MLSTPIICLENSEPSNVVLPLLIEQLPNSQLHPTVNVPTLDHKKGLGPGN